METLPRSVIQKIVKEVLPPDVRCSKETIDLLLECSGEFLNLIASEATEISEANNKNNNNNNKNNNNNNNNDTNQKQSYITPEALLKALTTLGFSSYVEQVGSTIDNFKETTKKAKIEHKATKLDLSTPEKTEMEKQRQKALFEESKRKLEQQKQKQKQK